MNRLLLGLAVLGTLSMPRTSTAAPMLSVQPSVTNVAVGDVFTLDVQIADVEDLFAFDVELSFDPTIVEALHIVSGSFLGTIVGTDVDTFSAFIDNGVGEASGAQSRLLFPGIGGTGVLFGIQFRALAVGTTVVDFDTSCDLLDPFCTALRNSLDDPLAFGSALGVVNVRAPLDVVPEPESIWLTGAGVLMLALRRRMR